MGLLLFSRKSSFHFIFMGLPESGFLGRKKIVVKRGYCRNFYGFSSALVLDDYDSCSNGGSSEEYEPIVPIIPRKGLHRCKALELCSIVVRVYKSLSWEVAREISFKRAMKRYGLFQSINAFKMFVHIFACAGMQMEVYALLKDIVFYFQKAEFDLDKLLPHLLNSPNDAKISALVVDVLIKVFAANKMLENGIEAYFQAKKLGLKLSNFSCNFLLKCLAEASRRELLQTLFEEMKQFGPSPTFYTYTIMMNFYCCKNHTQHEADIVKAIDIMEEMFTRGISPSVVTHSVYIHGLCRVGLVGIALDVVQRLRLNNEPLNSYCYNAVFHGFCAKGEVVKAVNLFEEMKSCGVQPDVYSSILIDGFSKCGDVDKGHCLIKEMEASNIKPSLVTYTSLLNGLCISGQMEKSINMFYELEEFGYKHDGVAYNILINGLCLQGDLVSAHKLLEEMISNNLTPNLYIYNAIINRLCKEGNLKRVLEVIPLMLKMNILPSVVNYSTLINGFAKQFNCKKAILLWEGMRKVGVTPNTTVCTIIINMFCMMGKVNKAIKYFEEMARKGFMNPDNISYTSIIAGFCRVGDMGKACKLFKRMEEKEILPSVVTYTCLMDGFCKINCIDEAIKLLDRMRKRNLSRNVVTYTVLIRAYIKRGQRNRALELFKQMRKEGIVLDERLKTEIT